MIWEQQNTLQTDKHDYTSFPFLWCERRLPRIQHFAELIENSLGEKKPIYFKNNNILNFYIKLHFPRLATQTE